MPVFSCHRLNQTDEPIFVEFLALANRWKPTMTGVLRTTHQWYWQGFNRAFIALFACLLCQPLFDLYGSNKAFKKGLGEHLKQIEYGSGINWCKLDPKGAHLRTNWGAIKRRA